MAHITIANALCLGDLKKRFGAAVREILEPLSQDLDQHVGALGAREERLFFRDGSRSIVGQRRRDLNRREPVPSPAGVVDRPEEVRGGDDVVEGEVEEEPLC
jgi:hypothetical protein